MVMEAAHINHQNLPSLAACNTFAKQMAWECQTWTKCLLSILLGGEKTDLEKIKMLQLCTQITLCSMPGTIEIYNKTQILPPVTDVCNKNCDPLSV